MSTWSEITDPDELHNLFDKYASGITKARTTGVVWSDRDGDWWDPIAISERYYAFQVFDSSYVLGLITTADGLTWMIDEVRWCDDEATVVRTIREEEDAPPVRAMTTGGIERELACAAIEVICGVLAGI